MHLLSPINGKPMEAVTLDDGLNAYRCKTTGGHYIPAANYMKWLAQQPARLPQVPKTDSIEESESDSTSALLCPESGTVMQRFKVGHGFPFSIDRSITGGIWLDGGEWEALRKRNFHDEINLVFTAPWQKQVRDEQAQATYEDRLKSALSPELLEKINAIRIDLQDHPNRNLALAYLAEIGR